MEQHSVARLIGASPGDIGYEAADKLANVSAPRTSTPRERTGRRMAFQPLFQRRIARLPTTRHSTVPAAASQQQTGPRAAYIIRVQEDRCTRERDLSAGPAAYLKVRDEVSGSKLRTTRTIELSQTPQRAARQESLEIRAITVEVQPPQARSHLPSVTHNVVLFEDIQAAGFEPVEVRSGYNGNSLGAFVEFRDERVAFFVRQLMRGKHSLSYRPRAEIPGQFSALPTKASAMYAPELKANSDEMKVGITD